MSFARIFVLFLNLVSLGALLFTLMLVAAPFLIPPALEFPGTAMEDFPPGCFSAMLLVLFTPLSLLPALAGWMIREKVIRPQETAERLWVEAAPLREERLRVWTGFITDLLLWECTRKDPVDDPVPARLQSEIPRALQELDTKRRQRLLLFLHEAYPGEPTRKILQGPWSGVAEPGTEKMRIPQSLVRLVAAGLSLVSAFFVLWAGLTVLTLSVVKPLGMIGVDYGFTVYVFGLSLLLSLALICGLGAAGLLRISRQGSFDSGEAGRAVLRDLTLRLTLDHLEALENWKSTADALSLLQRLARAVVLTGVPELGGGERGELLLALFRGGWIVGEDAVPLERADFRAAELAGAGLPKARLAGADLSGADLGEADLEEADLRGCGLCGSNLRSCRLSGADLREADLRAARFQSALLKGSNLQGARLDGANFWGADLIEADLSGTHGTVEFLAPAGSL